jgi:hypothetical protein
MNYELLKPAVVDGGIARCLPYRGPLCSLWPKRFNTESTDILRALCVGAFQRTEGTEKAVTTERVARASASEVRGVWPQPGRAADRKNGGLRYQAVIRNS